MQLNKKFTVFQRLSLLRYLAMVLHHHNNFNAIHEFLNIKSIARSFSKVQNLMKPYNFLLILMSCTMGMCLH